MRRPAYTLVEMLVVISLFLLIAALGYAIVPRMFSGQRRLSAVDQVAQWLVTARQRAKRDGVPTGVRLLLETDASGKVVLEDGSALVRQLQFVQQPEPLTGGWLTQGGVVGGQCLGVRNGVATFQNVDFLAGAETVDQQLVQPGDYLELRGGGSVHRIAAVATDRQHRTLRLTDSTVNDSAPTTNYRIIRQPRLLGGEKTLTIPGGTVVDLGPPSLLDPGTGQPLSFLSSNPTRSVKVPERITGGGPAPRQLVLEILFAPSGAVLSPYPGKMILWLRDPAAQPNEAKAQSLIAVPVSTGFVGVYEVAPGPSPYKDTEDGRASGL
jgi:prepilin-type N-terminal cleavage/methylation domain-containing protein